MKKRRLFALLAGSVLALTSCALFDDDDFAYENHYNPISTEKEDDNPNAIKVNGVAGTTTNEVDDALYFKNVYYGNEEDKILNTYKLGGVNENEFNVNNGNDYDASETKNTYDLFIPNSLDKTGKNIILLFIHGGAWISGTKNDMNSYVHQYANKGYITATMGYTLLSAASLINDEVVTNELSIFRDLDEIDACIKSIKESLVALGFDGSKLELMIGGASSGSHLTMLYTYSRGNKCPLPIKFILNAVGPVEIKPGAWKQFVKTDLNEDGVEEVLDAGLTKDKIAAQASASNLTDLKIMSTDMSWNEYQTMRVANGMCGFPSQSTDIVASTNEAKEEVVNPNAASTLMMKPNGGQDQLSITYWLGKVSYKIPIICVYAGKDTIVGINQYARLQDALDSAGYTSANHKYVYFKDSGHTDIDAAHGEESYNKLINYIDAWCQAETI